MSLVVTGASGQLGRHAAELLLGRLDSAQIMLVTRDPAALGGGRADGPLIGARRTAGSAGAYADRGHAR